MGSGNFNAGCNTSMGKNPIQGGSNATETGDKCGLVGPLACIQTFIFFLDDPRGPEKKNARNAKMQSYYTYNVGLPK